MKKNNWNLKSMGLTSLVAIFVFIGMATPGVAAYIEDPVAYWSLNDADNQYGESIGDDTYEGTCASCPDQINEYVNNGQNFDGAADGISVPPDVNGTAPFDWSTDDSFSIEFWMRRSGDNLTGNEVAVGRDDGDNTVDDTGLTMWAGINSDGKARFVLRDTSGTSARPTIISDTVVADGEWHHIVAIRNSADDKFYLYVDGKSEPSTGPVTAAFTGGFISLDDPLTIGYFVDHTGPRNHFGDSVGGTGGDLDEVALYGSALSQQTVKQHYLNGMAGKGLAEPFDPTILSTPSSSAAIGYTYTYEVGAAGNPTPTYALTTGPEGMQMLDPTLPDVEPGEIEWVPFYTMAGADHDFSVSASSGGSSSVQSATVSVYDLCDGDMDAYWDFNAGADLYKDVIGTNNGVCAGGGCPGSGVGVAGTGLANAGSTLGIDVPFSASGDAVFDWGMNDSFSIEFWMNRSNSNLDNEAVIGRDDGNLHWWIGINEFGMARFRLRDNANTNFEAVSTESVADGEWHHIVAVRDAGSSPKLYLYIDGQLAIETDNAEYVSGFASLDKPLNIAYVDQDGVAGNFFGGAVDELALYNFVLPAGIIEQHYMYTEQLARGYCNQAPVITGPAFLNILEDQLLALTLNDLSVTDPDSSNDELMLSIQDGDNYTYTGTSITPVANYSGVLTVKTTVSDKYHESAVYDLTVNVASINDAPVVGDILDQSILTGEAFQNITLDNFVTDAETPKEQIIWGYSGNTELIVSIIDRIATVTLPNASWTGSETITFRATDLGATSLSDADTVTFTVSETADPVVGDIPNQTIDPGGSFTPITLVVTDADNTVDELTWTTSGSSSLTVTIENGVATIAVPNATWTGAETITFIATDPNDGAGESTATFTVGTVQSSGGGGGGGGGGCFISSSGIGLFR